MLMVRLCVMSVWHVLAFSIFVVCVSASACTDMCMCVPVCLCVHTCVSVCVHMCLSVYVHIIISVYCFYSSSLACCLLFFIHSHLPCKTQKSQ